MFRTTVTLLAAAFISAVMVLAQDKKVEPSAKFVKTDDKTQGAWKTVYGADGYDIIADKSSYPKYVTVTPADKQDFTWADTSDDARALKKSGAEAKDGIAACWYSENAWSIDINFTDEAEHQVALYCLDWDTETRVMTIEVQNGDSGAKLDSQAVKEFNKGRYLVWILKGHVKLQITNGGAPNTVVSGIFFDPVKAAK